MIPMPMKCPRCDEEMYFDPDTGRWFCRMRFDGKHGRTHANGWPPAYLARQGLAQAIALSKRPTPQMDRLLSAGEAAE